MARFLSGRSGGKQWVVGWKDKQNRMKTAFERLEVYQLSERLGDAVWDMALGWDSFAKDTLGKQLVRAADSIGANIAEGYGRGSGADNRRFVRTARFAQRNATLAAAGLSSQADDQGPGEFIETTRGGNRPAPQRLFEIHSSSRRR